MIIDTLGIMKKKLLKLNMTQIIVGITIILIGIFVVYNGFKNPNTENQELAVKKKLIEQNNRLITKSENLIERMKRSKFNKYDSNFKNEAKELKISMEKTLGINCSSTIRISDFDRVNNPNGFERIIDDLYSLKSQIASQ